MPWYYKRLGLLHIYIDIDALSKFVNDARSQHLLVSLCYQVKQRYCCVIISYRKLASYPYLVAFLFLFSTNIFSEKNGNQGIRPLLSSHPDGDTGHLLAHRNKNKKPCPSPERRRTAAATAATSYTDAFEEKLTDTSSGKPFWKPTLM